MSEIEQKGQPHAMSPDLSESLNAAPAREYKKTAGERIHNEITFRGVDWIANTAFAVGLAYVAGRTKTGQKYFASPLKEGFEFALKPLLKDAPKRGEWAGHGVTFASIMLGGTAIIPPMMLLDHNKRPIVEWLDRKIYGDEAVEQQERFDVRYEAMMQEPKKSFSAGMLARGVVLAPMLWTHMKYNDGMTKGMYQPIADKSQAFCKLIGYQPQKLMKRRFPEADKQTDWEFLHTTFGMDISLTLIYSFAHEWVYKVISRIQHPSSPTYAQETTPKPQIHSGEGQLELSSLMHAPSARGAANG